MLKWAFEGKLTEQWRRANSQKSDLKTGEELLAQIKVERENRYQQQLAEWKEKVREWEAISAERNSEGTATKSAKKPTKPSKPKDLPPLTKAELAELPKLPDRWCWVKLGGILDDIEAGKSFRCEEIPPNDSEIGVAKVSAVTWGRYNELESKTS